MALRRFPSASRLTRKADLELVRHDGKRFRTTHLEVRYIASLLRSVRVGIIVPRHKQSAVARNRVKRRLRELSRQELLPRLRDAAVGTSAVRVDVVLRAMPSAYAAAFADLAHDVRRIASRLGKVE